MKVVIDSNILFSALIKDSTTRRLILEYDDFFLFPSYIIEELQKYKKELMKKSGLNESAFNDLLYLLLKKVLVVPSEVLLTYRDEAYNIVKDIDPHDVLFVACALAYQDSIIWGHDKRLKEEQNKVKVLTTKEFIQYVNKK